MSDDPQQSEQDAGAPDAGGRSARSGGLFGRRRVALSPSEALHPEAAPPPPLQRRKRPALEAFSGFLTFLLVAALVVGLATVFASRQIGQPGPLAADKVVLIAQGSDSEDIITQLQTQGVIDSPFLFTLALFVEGTRSKLKAGEYLFKQNASMQDVIDTIVQGKAILHSVTIPEGLTSQQIVARLREDETLAGDIRDIPREGALLPETYKFQRGDSRDKLLQKMAHDQKQLLDEIWRRRSPDLPLASPYDLVTLASIVEKETGKADERPRVASVFINRLRKHMRLQSDPTIVYGLVGGQGPLGRPLTRADIDSPTRYNTYLIDGLPPGPIANPGRAALEAVANPSRTQDLYFVADGTGGHIFADSLDSHNRNVQRWRQIEQTGKPKTGPAPSLMPGAAPAQTQGRGDRTEYRAPSQFGDTPKSAEFFARRAGATPLPPRLARDPAAIARLAPVLPDAPPAPRRVTDLALSRGAAPVYALNDSLADAEIGPSTRAEALLDGPAADAPVNPRPTGQTLAANAGALDGPAAPVEDAMGYASAPINAAPNGKPRILDASEGTALDPLLNKSWDLNSAKTVDLSSPFDAPSPKRKN